MHGSGGAEGGERTCGAAPVAGKTGHSAFKRRLGGKTRRNWAGEPLEQAEQRVAFPPRTERGKQQPDIDDQIPGEHPEQREGKNVEPVAVDPVGDEAEDQGGERHRPVEPARPA